MDLDMHQDYLSLMYCHEEIVQVQPPPEEEKAEEASAVVKCSECQETEGDDLLNHYVSWQDQLRVPMLAEGDGYGEGE